MVMGGEGLWVAGEASALAQEAAVPVHRSDPRQWPSHWRLVSSGRTLQLEGGTSKSCAPEPRVSQRRRVLSMLEELNLLLGRAGDLISLFEP